MNIKNKMHILLAILGVFYLTGCAHHHRHHYATNNFKKAAEDFHIVNWVGVSRTGEVIVLNSRNGERIPTCKPRDTDYSYKKTDSNIRPCKVSIEKRNGETIIRRNGKPIELLNEEHIWFFNYPGGDCQSNLDSNGNQTDDCW